MPFELTDIVAAITAIGALGTAAFGLVDATKALGGGVSNLGLDTLYRIGERFEPALLRALGKTQDGSPEWRRVIRAHWVNGRPRDEQKAIVRSLVRLGLDPESAPSLATFANVTEARLVEVARRLTE